MILSHNSTGKTAAPRVAIKLKCALYPGVNALPENVPYAKQCSGKAFADLTVGEGAKVITLNPNSLPAARAKDPLQWKRLPPKNDESRLYHRFLEDETGGYVPLPEAEIVVSGGRGLKGPEKLGIDRRPGQCTRCRNRLQSPGGRRRLAPSSRARGQTGITIKPTLYIAVGISGAIQHRQVLTRTR